MKHIDTIGALSCLAGGECGCAEAPARLRGRPAVATRVAEYGLRLEWWPLLRPRPDLGRLEALWELCRRIRALVAGLVARRRVFLFVGGDHACAMGVWSGAMRALGDPKRMGLIWIDAHMDAHNYTSSPSGNPHGMPVAALLGAADPLLADIHGFRPALAPGRRYR